MQDIKILLEKLIDFLKPEGEGESILGICLIGQDDVPIEMAVNDNLKIDYTDKFLLIDSEDYIGIIRIDQIAQITEV